MAILAFSARRQRTPTSQYFTAQVETGPLRNVVNATGVVQTVVTVQVGSQVSGQVEELYADFNSVVKRGQLSGKLDPRNFRPKSKTPKRASPRLRRAFSSAEADSKTQAANLLSAKANLEAARVDPRQHRHVFFQRASELSKERRCLEETTTTMPRPTPTRQQRSMNRRKPRSRRAEAQSHSAAAQLEQAKAQLQQAEADLLAQS